MRMNDKLKKDLIFILRKGYHNSSNLYKISEKIFGEDKKCIMITKKISPFEYYNALYNFDKYFNKLKFHCHDEHLGEKEQFEIEPGKFKSFYSDGGVYEIEKNNIKFILSIIQHYKDDMEIIIIAENKDVEKLNNIMAEFIKYSSENSYLKNTAIKPNLSFVKLDKKYIIDDLIIPDDQKESILKNLSLLLNKSEQFAKYNFSKGLLLAGRPGVGKSLLGKVLASQTKEKGYTFLWIVPGDFMWITPSTIYSLARKLRPCLVFMEDLDLFGEVREASSKKELLGELLNELSGLNDNRNIVTIATTNDLDSIEGALKNRPGRFDSIYKIELPNIDCICKMLQRFTKDFDIKIDLEDLSKQLTGLTGAHIQELINQIIYESILNNDTKITIKSDYIDKVLPKIKQILIKPTLGFSSCKRSVMDILDEEND